MVVVKIFEHIGDNLLILTIVVRFGFYFSKCSTHWFGFVFGGS